MFFPTEYWFIGIYFVAYIATRGKVTTEFSFQTHGRTKKKSPGRTKKKSPNPTPTVTRQVTANHVRAHGGRVGSRSPPYAGTRKKESSSCRIGKDVKISQTQPGLEANVVLQ
jgi:hypothetical protein